MTDPSGAAPVGLTEAIARVREFVHSRLAVSVRPSLRLICDAAERYLGEMDRLYGPMRDAAAERAPSDARTEPASVTEGVSDEAIVAKMRTIWNKTRGQDGSPLPGWTLIAMVLAYGEGQRTHPTGSEKEREDAERYRWLMGDPDTVRGRFEAVYRQWNGEGGPTGFTQALDAARQESAAGKGEKA